MNHGRFFRLNQRNSKVADGVAIFDYIDLPAFFGPLEEHPTTPKYPVSVVISADAVRFRLHYALLCLGETNDNPAYFFQIEDLLKHSKDNPNHVSKILTVHMEEVFLELHYNDAPRLEETVKGIYTTLFPMPTSGGHYLERLIRTRYRINQKTNDNQYIGKPHTSGIVDDLFNKMHEEYDSMLAYSTLKVMGIHDGKRINLFNENDDGSTDCFLRKLLLDFLFDLRHTDIFQLSPNYHQMLSGLMSVFYFSALSHKCEYYYQLSLAGNAFDKAIIANWTTLYGKDLFDSENCWIHDIMSPQAEQCFHSSGKPSWFLHPEEEMKQVTLYSNKNNNEIQNVDHLIRYRIKQNDSPLLKDLVDAHDRTREEVSRWFLRRYDWSDILRLHFHNSQCTSPIVTSAILIMCVFFVILKPCISIPIALWFGIAISLFAFVRMCYRHENKRVHVVACIHLLLPRLVASIATAWFTIGLSFDLIITFFDKPVSWFVILFIILVLLLFSTYKINQVSPRIDYYHKVGRAAQLIIFSYFISFAIGTILVHFIGYPFLIHEVDPQSVNNIVNNISMLGLHSFRNFTVMFSFVAMFIGIFIQLIILDDNKQMTEL